MADRDEDDSFVEEFMRRAREREAKIREKAAEIQLEAANMTKQQEVSYPPLSPLPEENSGVESPEVDQNETSVSDDERGENVSPDDDDDDSRLNYSSDLSLDCEASDVYRAEPAMCHSSPDHQFGIPSNRQPSPRKQAPSCPPKPVDLSTALHERQPEQKATSSQSLPEQSQTQNEVTLRDFQRKVDRAYQNKQQLRKAVEASKQGSREHVEAARLLQIAELEHQIFDYHLAQYKKGERKSKSESLGSIKIQNIRLKMSSKLRNDLAEEGVLHNFFIVLSCGTEIKATEIVNTDRIRHQDLKAYLHFKDCITFVDLPPDFIVRLEVFELVVRQQSAKFLSRLTPSKKQSKITPDHFKRIGSMRLNLADRDCCHKNLVQWSEYEKSKYIEKECKFDLELKPEQLPCKTGMLHVRCFDSEGLPDWSRCWVDLSDSRLRFWETKQDATDGKKPNQVLELAELCCDGVQKLVPTDDLYRQHSFVVFTLERTVGGDKNGLFQCILEEDPKFKIVKHQYAASSKEDRDSWSTILDRSMRCFREWNGTTKIYTTDELRAIFSSSN